MELIWAPVDSAAVHSKALVMLLFIYSLLLLPFFVRVFGTYFVFFSSFESS